MRNTSVINNDWVFKSNGKSEQVNLPHCFNAADGTTKDYFRGKNLYSKELSASDRQTFLYIEGANSVCEVTVGGKVINSHRGGYGGFATDLTDYIKNGCQIDIYVDNSDFADVYPSRADFTFWGGLYRNVSLIETDKCHFSFRDYSSNGVYVTPKKTENGWFIYVKALIDGAQNGYTAQFTLLDADGKEIAFVETDAKSITEVKMNVDNPILWDGREKAYLYTLKAEIKNGKTVLDNLNIETGFRTFYIDNEKGFFLNDRHIKLKGVSRHQDRQGMGNAITEKEHAEDLNLILEVGANSIRLAHYQQNGYFYNLCDKNGVLVWAESPIISAFSAGKQENAKNQLAELIKQNYNHPCIFCWGIENEITQDPKGAKDKKLVPCMRELNSLVKKLDTSRYSTCAQLSVLDQNSPLNFITDIEGYNHYFGWYDFGFDYLDRWLDDFHNEYPEVKLCLSEYGAEGLVNLHSENPVQGDYSEEYQCVFHEHYIKAINSREWLWGSFVWNMFDFGAANRREGGVVGKNNKGLATYDRKTKKDSFYLYKAYWCEKPFVHICGERFSNRLTGKTQIKVYSNCKSVTLKVNGREFTEEGEHIFVFRGIEIENGENILSASYGECSHSIILNGSDKIDKSYSLTGEQSFVRNWAKKSESEQLNYLSPESTIKDLAKSTDAHIIIDGKLSRDYLNSPLLKLLYPLKINTVLKAALKFGLTKNYYEMLCEYTRVIHK